ncbi:Carbamoyl-phosphate synthase small chain [Candidatus Lokiarchaeum ossiferum]|uniref:Carbamoyl-phosphate synthase small chain n=1 Tax=Candidatus Lokiarchaeum ossiferum TaxID=2951803 RepID=A0ABY6HU24_9ARCH|nr:Carbamoyl-phosphate synthase small chain [Candidatus Lokiarchaeum sp. B-35]
MKKLVIIDCYEKIITPHRDKGFQNAFNNLDNLNWEYIRYEELINPSKYTLALESDGIIISGSQLNIPDPSTQEKMSLLIKLVKEYSKPILGICFGLQLIGYIFGFIIQKMENPEAEWDKEITLTCQPPFALLDDQTIEVDVHHAYEIQYIPELEEIFTCHASTEACKVEVITHRSRPIYGVQFHPETYKSEKIVESGKELLRKFVALL